MKLKTVLIFTTAATLVAANNGRADDTVRIPPGKTVVEIAPGSTAVDTSTTTTGQTTTTTVVAPEATIVAPEATVVEEPSGAAHEWDWSMKDRFNYDRDSKDLYAPNEFTLDLAGAYGVGKQKFNDTFDRSSRHGKFGASVGANYFITRNFGIGADAWGLDNGSDFVDAVSGSAILRLPIDVAHLAPYVFGGGGRTFDGPDSWFAHVGAGLELRLNPRTGFFIDGRHIFAEKNNVSDAALFRAGIRMAF